MKKFFIILSVIFVVLIGAIIILPIIFKGEIKQAVQTEIEKNIKAKVFFDENKIGVSILKNFPNITLTLRDFGLVGVDPFQDDTLFSASRFALTVDIKSVISGDNISLKKIDLDNPRIFVLVLKNGKANYDIAVDSGTTADTTSSGSSNMKIGIQSWNITNGRIVYDDESMPMLAVLDGLNHTGSGDFSTSVFDMKTHTTINNMLISYGGVDYIKNKKLDADITMNMDLNKYKFTFRENSVKLNDFGLKFDGYFAMPKEGYDMDINFKSEENSFKSLFSMVPETYLKGYENIKADGTFTFEGFVKGLYSDSLKKMPAFRFALKTNNGSVKYPDLPEEIKNVNVDFLVDNKDGVIDNTTVDLKKFHVDFGNNPIDATLHVDNLKNYKLKATMAARFNLGDVTKMVPLDSTEIAGMLDASLSVDGVYDSTKHIIPAQGTLSLSNFSYKSPMLPQGMKISSTRMNINTSQIDLDHFDGTVGKSDMHMKGFLSNYVDYVFAKDAVLHGQLDFSSKEFNANEWMTSDTTSTSPEDTSTYQLVQIPKSIDFTLNSSIGKIDYENLALEDFKGMLIVKDGILRLQKVGFNTLGGVFGMDGTYDTRDMTNPLFDFNFSIQDLSIPVAYKSFNTVQKMAPVAKVMEGKFSTNFKMNGKLQNDYMPDYNSVQGDGLLKISDAKVKGSETKIVSRISSVTKLGGGGNGDITLKDVQIKFQIINGRIYTEPFNVKIANNNALIAGSSGLDGTLDYTIKMDVPAAAVNAAASLVSSVTGQKFNLAGTNMKMNLGVKGNYDDPKVSLLGAESGGSSSSAKESMQKAVEQKKEEVVNQAKTVVQEQKKEAEKKIDSVAAQQKQNVQKEVDKATKDVKGKLKGLFKKGGN